MNVLGLMSGTSMDGLDCCLAEIVLDNNYNFVYRILNSKCYDFSLKTRSIIHDYIFYNKYSINYIDNYLGELFSKYCIKFLKNNKVDLIALHGQTVKHIDGECSIQIGNPKIMNNNLNLPIVYNFRNADILNGGNGAPLVPFLDWLLYSDLDSHTLSINIGGISNFSLIKSKCLKNDIIGFDTGPGMCLIDRYVQDKWNIYYDKDGDISSTGKIDSELLHYLMQDKFINKQPPKSASANMYDYNYLLVLNNKFPSINKNNFLRTLLNFTAKSIRKNVKMYINNVNKKNTNLIISGGGSKNRVLFRDICTEFSSFKNVKKLNYNDINIDNKEAFLICVMGYTKYNSINNNIPAVTGASNEVICGEIYE